MNDKSQFQAVHARISGRQNTNLQGLAGLGVAHLAASLSSIRPLVLVAPNLAATEDLLRDIRFLFGEDHSEAVLYLPANEKTPFHTTSPDPVVVMERAATLFKLAIGAPFRVLVTSPEALVTKVLPLESLQKMAEMMARGATTDRLELLRKLELGGYSKVNAVEDMGTYAVRGSIIDIFWAGAKYPVRLDFFGDEIERIHRFDPQTQRTLDFEEEFQFGPAREIFLDEASVSLADQRLRDLADEVEYPTKKLRDKLEDIENGIPFFGIESLLPAFHQKLESPLALMQRVYGDHGVTVFIDGQEAFSETIHSLTSEYEEQYGTALARGELCFSPGQFLLTPDALWAQINQQTQLIISQVQPSEHITLHTEATDSLRQDILRQTTRTDDTTEVEHAHHLLTPLARRIKQLKLDGITVLLPVQSLGGTQRIKELLQPHGINIRVLKIAPDLLNPSDALHEPAVHAFTYAAEPEPPVHGVILPFLHLAIFAEDEIFGKRARRGAGKKGVFRTTLSDLEVGDYIVHVDHGVGVFKGLTRLNVRGVEQDYVLLHYADDDKLYLPVHRINMIQRYSGVEGKAARLDKLGGSGWQTKKAKVKQAVMAMAQDLLNLYAKRELAKRPHCAAPNEMYWEFEARFAFETTPDQQKAIDEVIADLQKERPMDRLICGDVGYGKTEVAMRAAMLAVAAGRQVAVLAPTTVLAQQHAINFTERFRETGAQVAVVSRFQKTKEVNETIKKAKEGKVDILIGTHRILSSDVSFKNLGLVVVDEEQRFGIKAKEHLKKLRTQTDVLTMSATPIPRTLQMGFFGIRDLSIIETPPVDRRAIRTSIVRFEDEVIREAILREIGRSGQVYFVHNRVSSIHATADYLRKLVPEAKIEIGHGQMDAEDLENVMIRFMNHEFNVLVCTTIIETGIDVSSANTMFINNADDFGLAQLYQLRGRVGRSKERAFAYLLIPSSTEHLTPVARKRLEILHRFSELGAGFKIAQHDLELRGAGDLLGSNQHGHVAAVGYDLYAELLKEAVEDLRGRTHEDVPDPDINLALPAFIPDKYVPDLHERMGFYQRLATAQNGEEIWDVVASMQDQVGEPPEEVHHLAEVMILKQALRKIAARGLDASIPTDKQPLPQVVISLGDHARLDGQKVAAMVARDMKRLTLTPKMKLIYNPSEREWLVNAGQNVFTLCKQLLQELQQAV